MKRKLLCISLPIAALDQAIKAFIRSRPLGEVLFEIKGVAAITHSVNTGAAFSMLSRQTALLALASALLLAALTIYVSSKMRLTHAAQGAFWCMIGGGAGNLIDRVAFSGVTDYIRLLLFDFPIFNFADMAITGSIAVLIFLLFTGNLEKATGEEHESDH